MAGFFCLFSAACSDAKFAGLLSGNKGENEAGIQSPVCIFLRQPHPELDSMLFDIGVSSHDVILNSAGLRHLVPENMGAVYAYMGVPLPVGADGKVTVSVSSGNQTGSCETRVFPVAHSVSPAELVARSGSSGTVRLTWKWRGLYRGESISFDPRGSQLSQDLRATCESLAPVENAGGAGFDQTVDCQIRFTSTTTARSVRYKDQQFAWALRQEPGDASFINSGSSPFFQRSLGREASLDLILANSLDPQQTRLRDPETCAFTRYPGALPFSHICTGLESLLGGAAGGPPLCEILQADACPP